MDTATLILVWILGFVLLISLIVYIVVGVMLAKLVKTLRQIAEKGEDLVETAEEIGDTIKQNMGAAGLVHTFAQLVKIVARANNKKRRK